MTVAVAMTVPWELTAVIVYIVEVNGETRVLPNRSTAPTVGLMDTDVALLTSHFRTEVPPSRTMAGVGLKIMIFGALGFTVTEAGATGFLAVLFGRTAGAALLFVCVAA